MRLLVRRPVERARKPGKSVVGLTNKAATLLEQGSSVGLWDVARQVTGKRRKAYSGALFQTVQTRNIGSNRNNLKKVATGERVTKVIGPPSERNRKLAEHAWASPSRQQRLCWDKGGGASQKRALATKHQPTCKHQHSQRRTSRNKRLM